MRVLTDDELEFTVVFGVRAPSRSDISFLLLQGLQEEFDLVFPGVDSWLD